MRRAHNYQQSYTSSVLDRLITPSATGEAGELRLGTRAALEAALQRDLTALLNTRCAHDLFPAAYPESNKSLLMFGLPDMAAFNLRLTSEQNRFRRVVETALQNFEPRLTNIRVKVERWDEAKPLLRFQITALLSDEPVSFETVIRRDSGEFQVRKQAV